MLKVLENGDEALERLTELAAQPELSGFMVGLAGSFASNTNKKNSKVDVVLKARNSEHKLNVGSFDIIEFIERYTFSRYHNKFNVIWLDLLEDRDAELINLANEEGVTANKMSAYVNIAEGVKWCD